MIPMPRVYPEALPFTRKVLSVLIALNLIWGVLIALLLVASLIAGTPVMTALGIRSEPGSWALYVGMRSIMVFGLCGVPLTHLILTRLREIVGTVGAGDPFVGGNATRLAQIAWGVLGLEVLHVAVATAGWLVSTRETPVDVGRSFSIAPWLAVLLLFVLARVFEHGTRMREELEATI